MKDLFKQNKVIKNLVVLGGGTAGLLCALTLKKFNPDLGIRLVRSTKIGHIMVGEGTVGSTPKFFHDTLGFCKEDFYRNVKPTWKLGVRFLWGKRPYFDYTFINALAAHPNDKTSQPLGYFANYHNLPEDWCLSSALMSHNKAFIKDKHNSIDMAVNRHAYHFENSALIQYLEDQCRCNGIELIDDQMRSATQGASGIEELQFLSGRNLSADLYIDATGFSGKLIHEALEQPYESMSESLFCDRAVVGGWSRGAGEVIKPYTTAETMDAGWCWQIEHRELINRGYVYCSAFISDEQAEHEFRRKNPNVIDTRVIHFYSQRVGKPWTKNVVAIGNANGFVEPLEATNIQVIANFSLKLANILQIDRALVPHSRDNFNRFTRQSWDSVRDFLALHYKYNDRLNTPFWKMARHDTPLGQIGEFVEYYQKTGPNRWAAKDLLPNSDLFGAEGYLSMLVGMQVPFDRLRRLEQTQVDQARLLRKLYQYQALNNGLSIDDVINQIDVAEWP